MAKAMLRLCMQDSQRTEDCLVKAYQRPAKRKEITAAREAVNGLCGGEVVLFRAVLGRLFGINAALFLGQLVYWSDKGADPSGWIFKSTDEWESELCLTYKQQRHVRQVLKEAAVVEDRYTPGSARELKFRVKWDALLRVLEKSGENDLAATCPKGRSPHAQREGPPAQKEEPHAQRAAPIHKSTTETTAEEPPKSSRREDFDASLLTKPPYHPEEAQPPAPHPKTPELDVVTPLPPAHPEQASQPVASDRKTEPLPDAAAGAPAQSLALQVQGGHCLGFPTYRDPGFPRCRGTSTPDWAAAIAKYDPFARVLPALFPEFRWVDHPREARRYFTRRRKNHIRDHHLMMLQHVRETERGEQTNTCWPRSVAELITRFPEVIGFVERDVAGELEALEARIEEFFNGDTDYAMAEFSRACESLKAPGINDIKAALGCRLYTGLRWPILIALAISGEKIALVRETSDEVLTEVAMDPVAVELLRNAKCDISATFGFTLAEAIEQRRRAGDRMAAERNRLRAALGRETAEIHNLEISTPTTTRNEHH